MIDIHQALSDLKSHQLRQIWNEGSLFSPISTGTCSSAIGKVPQLLPVKRYKIRSNYDGVFTLNFSRDGAQLAVGYGSGDVTLHNSTTAKLKSCPSRKSDQLPVTGLHFTPHTDYPQLIYCLANGHVFLQKLEDEGDSIDVTTAKEENEINTLDCSEFGYYFATAGKDRNIRIYDWESFKPFTVLGPLVQGEYIGPPEDTLTQHGKRIFSVKFSDTSPYHLVSGGWDNSVKMWDLRSNGVVRSMSTHNHGPKLCGDALAIKDDLCVTGSLLPEKAIELWSIKEGRRIAVLPYECPALRGEYILVVKFCGSSNIIAGSASCHDAQIISTVQEKVVARIDGFRRSVSAMAVSETGKVAIAGGAPYISFVETMTTPFFLEET